MDDRFYYCMLVEEELGFKYERTLNNGADDDEEKVFYYYI